MKKGDVVFGGLVPAHQDATETVQPTLSASATQRPALNPASRLMDFASCAAAADVGGEAELFQRAANLVKVVSLVQAHALGLLQSGFRTRCHQAVQGRPHQLHVVAIGPVHRRTHWNALGLGQQAALDAPLTATGGVGAGFPPPGVIWSWPRPCSTNSVQALQFRVAAPIYSYLISPSGVGGILRSLILTRDRSDILEYH